MNSSDQKEKPLISVIIPTHNRAALLQEALASVYAQEGTGKEFEMEVILVDDASSDNTAEVARRYPGLRYIRLATNRGQQVARNTGIKASRGKYLSFLDDDDLWLPYKLLVLLPVLEARPEIGVAYGQTVVRFRNQTRVKPDAQQGASGRTFYKSLMNLRSFVGMHMSLVRKEAFDKAGYFDEELTTYQDYDMELRLAFHYPFFFVPVPVAIYRRSMNGNFATKILQGRHESALRRVVEKALALVPDNGRGSADFKRRVLTQMHLRIAQELESIREFERAQTYLLTAIKDSPWMTTQPWARSSIVQKVVRFALASDSPVDTARTSCATLRDIARRCTLRESLGLQRLLAEIWWRVTYGVMQNGRKRLDGGVACAVLNAALYNPHKIGLAVLKLLSRKVRATIQGTRAR